MSPSPSRTPRYRRSADVKFNRSLTRLSAVANAHVGMVDRTPSKRVSMRQQVRPASSSRVDTNPTREMLNKVPEVTVFFWIIKILATTVGETAADFLGVNLNFGLTVTTLLMSVLLVVALVFQFRNRDYKPGIYWLSVVLISVVGTLITDNLVDNFGVALRTTTIIFAVALTATFSAWYASERTLSIHTVTTSKREGFYWLTILFTFALGTASGDLLAEGLNIGYWQSALVFGGAIGLVAVAHFKLGLNAIVAFWIAYILTRPLGASLGDYLSQKKADGGLGLGTTITSAIFLSAILGVVVYLAKTRRDVALTPG